MMILRYCVCIWCVLSMDLLGSNYKIVEFGYPQPHPSSSSRISYSSADSINERGQVVGHCSFSFKTHIYLWDPINGFTYQIEKRTSTPPCYINNNGEISTLAINDSGDKYSISNCQLMKNGRVIENSLKWVEGYMLRVNNCGQVAGVIELSPHRRCGVIFDEEDKSVINICANTGYLLAPSDINDLGMIVGSFYNGQEMGFLWTPSFGLQYLEGFTPKAINNLGIIVGSRSPEIAVIWDKGNLIDFSKAIKLDTDLSTDVVRLTVINDINDQNQLVGEGKTQSNCTRYVAILPT